MTQGYAGILVAQFHSLALEVLQVAFGEVGESQVQAPVGLKCSHMETRKAALEEGPSELPPHLLSPNGFRMSSMCKLQ